MNYRSEDETPVGAVIGGALGGLFLIIVIMVVVILTSRAIYKSFFVSAKYSEVSGVHTCDRVYIDHHLWQFIITDIGNSYCPEIWSILSTKVG